MKSNTVIYSVTISISKDIAESWEHYMRSTHISDVMATGCFYKASFRKDTEDQASAEMVNYNTEYYANSMDDYLIYETRHAPALREEHSNKFEGKFTASRRVFELVEEKGRL